MRDFNSNVSRPMPAANTGSTLLNWISDTFTFLLHVERRFDPRIRPAFDALFCDLIASWTTALILSGRRMIICAVPWWHPWPREMSSSTFACNCKLIPILCQSAGETIAADLRRDPAHPQAEIRPPGLDGVRETAFYNPWHTIADHRPLGNQSRARRRMYLVLSELRHSMNAVPHYEPTGD
jgi:hypothetical protein